MTDTKVNYVIKQTTIKTLKGVCILLFTFSFVYSILSNLYLSHLTQVLLVTND